MLKGTHDIFARVMNFLGANNWHPKHVTLGLFEVVDNHKKTLAKNLIELLENYNLSKNIIVYVKDEKFNLNIMTFAWKIVVSCDILGLEESYQGICFGHAFSRACQYVIANDKAYKDLTYVFIKIAQGNL
jgi:hypothetical protein